MKRLLLLYGDIKFQYRYGFYFLYAFFSAVYIFILGLIPFQWKTSLSFLLIFSDPTLIGLIFSGAIIHLEFSQRTFESLAIAPVGPGNVLFSKAFSLSLISLASAVVIGLSVGVIESLLLFMVSVLLGSFLCSLIGITLACKAKSLNHFFFKIVPFMILFVAPGGVALYFDLPIYTILHPGVAMMKLLSNGNELLFSGVILLFWIAGIFWFARRVLLLKMKS